MNIEEFKNTFLKFACPYLLFITPIGLILTYMAPNPPEDHLGAEAYFLVTALGIIIIWFSFRYCRDHLGWFGGKK